MSAKWNGLLQIQRNMRHETDATLAVAESVQDDHQKMAERMHGHEMHDEE